MCCTESQMSQYHCTSHSPGRQGRTRVERLSHSTLAHLQGEYKRCRCLYVHCFYCDHQTSLRTKVCQVVAKFTASNLSIQLVPAHITDCSKCSINAHLHSSLMVEGTIWDRSVVGIAKPKLSIVAAWGR